LPQSDSFREGQGELIAAQQRRLEAQVLDREKTKETIEKWNRQREPTNYKKNQKNPEFLEKCCNFNLM